MGSQDRFNRLKGPYRVELLQVYNYRETFINTKENNTPLLRSRFKFKAPS